MIQEDPMSAFVRWFFRVWSVLILVVLCLHLSHMGKTFPLRPIWWAIGVLAGLVIVVATVWERRRRMKDGYYVDTLGGAENGTVRYHEAGRTLELYFDRARDTVYVPNATCWPDIVPGWAQNRREEIVGRIKRHIGKRVFGKGWTYEETDK